MQPFRWIDKSQGMFEVLKIPCQVYWDENIEVLRTGTIQDIEVDRELLPKILLIIESYRAELESIGLLNLCSNSEMFYSVQSC